MCVYTHNFDQNALKSGKGFGTFFYWETSNYKMAKKFTICCFNRASCKICNSKATLLRLSSLFLLGFRQPIRGADHLPFPLLTLFLAPSSPFPPLPQFCLSSPLPPFLSSSSAALIASAKTEEEEEKEYYGGLRAKNTLYTMYWQCRGWDDARGN